LKGMTIKAQNPDAVREAIRQRQIEIKRLELILELSEFERKTRTEDDDMIEHNLKILDERILELEAENKREVERRIREVERRIRAHNTALIQISELEGQLAERTEEIRLLRGALDGCRSDAALLEENDKLKQELERVTEAARASTKCLHEKEQENERLKAELEKRMLRWQTGTIPQNGCYLYRLGGSMGAAAFCAAEFIDYEWAGPILPPEDE